MLYPIFDKSMRSNLSVAQKADIWRHLFIILRTLMNVEPHHVLRLFKGKYLLQTVRSCLIRWGISQHMLTRSLLNEVLNIARDANDNKQGEVIEEFYRRFVFDIMLDESFCDLSYLDTETNRRGLIFEEISETVYQMFRREEA